MSLYTSNEAMHILRAQSQLYKEYVALKRILKRQKVKLMRGELGEKAAFTYYIKHDYAKELKHKLKEQHLI